jgi:ribosomal protein L37AE/L43A
MTTCICGNPTRDDAYTCDPCGDRLARVLGDMPWLDSELDVTITKQRASAFADGGQSAEKALIYDAAASAKRDALRTALVTAVRFCAEEGVRNQDPSDEPPADTLVAMSRWLLWRVDGLALNDMGHEFGQAIIDAARDCRRTIDAPPDRAYAGPCPECSRDLYHRPDAGEVKCRGCGSSWNVGEVNAWMRGRIEEHMKDRLVTAREGSTLLGRLGLPVGQGTIDKWRERNRITEAGQEPAKGERPGARLYRWDDLLTLAARHARAS